MLEFLAKLFSSDFMGHGYCYLWRPEIVWLHAVSDGLITISYYVIPVMLVYLVRQRRDLPFHWMFFMFGVFILGCGTTHAMEIWTLWHGTYRLAGIIKAITAGASLATAVALVPMVPKAMALPSPSQLRAANLELEKEIAERRRVEQTLAEERDFAATVLNTVGTLIVVIDLNGKILHCNSACEHLSGRSLAELKGREVRELFTLHEEGDAFQMLVEQLPNGTAADTFEGHLSAKDGSRRLISWVTTVWADGNGKVRSIIASGADVTESKRLEKEVLDISAREQNRIGQDLHDGLGQHLTGIAFLSKVLEQKLAGQGAEEAQDADRIVHLVNEAIDKTRKLSRGLLPVDTDAQGLMSALERWAREVENTFGVECSFDCESPVSIEGANVATHLYRIAQEALNNAIKHGRPTRIEISLEQAETGIVMIIRDNGSGLPPVAKRGGGMGLRIMNYRASMIGATLKVERGREGGTVVTCHLQSDDGRESAAHA